MTYGFGSGTPDPLVLNDGTFTNLTATGSFTSPGIDDNATGTKIVVDDSGVGFGAQSSPAYEVDIRRTSGNFYGRWQLSTGQPGFLYSDAGGAGFTFGSAAILSNSGSLYAGTNNFTFYQGSSGTAAFSWRDNSASELMNLDSGGDLTVAAQVQVGSYTVATVPSASNPGAGSHIFVTDEIGGATGAYSDGTNWRRYSDRAIVS